MSSASSCPHRSVLQALALGALPESAAAPVEEHLAGCPRCLETMRQLPLDDPLVAPLRGAAPAGEVSPDYVARLAAKLHAGSRGAGSGPPPATPHDPFGSTLVPEPPSDHRVILGRYKLIQPIGEGGMGTVYMAQQFAPVERKVAVKLIKLGCDSKAVLTRFKAEQQAIALMDHPNIARLYDAGITERGEPFFVMELIHGLPIAEYCDANRLGVDDRVRLVMQVCHAIEHAHQKGIIHRDLKSSNILIAQYDGVAAAKVIDFGLAKALGHELTHETSPSLYGLVAGTPGYMSPEQATSNQLDVDARSDIYSLSAVLYELLTGSTPHDQAELKKKGMMEVLRSIREDEPPAASKRLSSSGSLPSLAASRRLEPRRLVKSIRGELDLVVMKGLQRERGRRYQHSSDFAEDLQRLLNGERVHAVPPSLGYLTAKFLRKRWKGVLAAVLLLLVALAGAAGVVLQEFEKQKLAATAESSRLRADASEKERQLAVARAEAGQARERQLASAAEAQKARADAIKRESAAGEYFGLMGEIAGEEQQRSAGWRTRALEKVRAAVRIDTAQRNPAELRTLVARIAQSPDVDPEPEWTLRNHSIASKQPLAYSSSGKLLAVALSSQVFAPNPTVLVVDAATGRIVQRLVEKVTSLPIGLGGQLGRDLGVKRITPVSVAFGADDSVLFVGLRDGRLLRWTLDGVPRAISVQASRSDTRIVVTRDGQFVVTHVLLGVDRADYQIRCWDARDLKPTGEAEFIGVAGSVAVLPDDRSILASSDAGTFAFSLPDLKKLREHAPQGELACNHTTGVCLTTGNGRLRIVSPENLDPIAALDWPRRSGLFVDFTRPLCSADGRTIGCLNRMVNQIGMWHLGDPNPFAVLGVHGESTILYDALAPVDGRLAVVTAPVDERRMSPSETVSGFRIRPSREFQRVFVSGGGWLVSAAPDGGEAAAYFRNDRVSRFQTGGDGLALMTEIPTGRHVVFPEMGRNDLSYSPDGRWLVATGDYNSNGGGIALKIISRTPKATLRTLPITSIRTEAEKFTAGRIVGFGWTESGHLVAAVCDRVLGWNLEPDQPREIPGVVPPDRFTSNYAAFWMAGNNGWALTRRRGLHRIRFSTGSLSIAERLVVPGEGTPVFATGHAGAGLLAFGDNRGAVQLLDSRTGGVVATDDTAHTDQVESLAWCHAQRLLTASRDGSVVVWRVSGRTFAPEFRIPFKSGISSIAASPDGSQAYVTCPGDGELTVIDLAALERLFESLGIR